MASVTQIGLLPSGLCSGPQIPEAGEDTILSGSSRQTLSLSKEQAVALCWRVKKWKLDFELEQQGDIWTNGGTQWIAPFDWTATANASDTFSVIDASPQPASHITWTIPPDSTLFSASTETDLVCYRDNSTFAALECPVSTESTGDPEAGVTTFMFKLDLTRVPQKNQSGAYLVSVGYYFNFGLQSPVTFPARFNTGSSFDLEGSLQFAGYSFPVFFRSGDFGSPPRTYPTTPLGPSVAYSYHQTTNFSLVISAAEYWPYDPGDGLGPIYDSTTGAQLRPFPV